MKKILATLLAAAMLVSVFGACQTETADDTAGESSATTSETEPDDKEEDEPEVTESDIDDSDYVWNEAYADAPHKLTMMVRENTGNIKLADREKYDVWNEIEALAYEKGLAMGLEIIQSDQYQTTLQTRLASGVDLAEYISVYGITEGTEIEQIENGTFLPILDLIENGDGTAKEFFEKYPWGLTNSTYVDGEVYWIPAVQEAYYEGAPATATITPMIREDWMNKIGMSVYDLKTSEDLYNAMVAMQAADTNENGMPDEQYIRNINSFAEGITEMFGMSSDYWQLSIETGEVTPAWEMPGVYDYFDYMVRMFESNLISYEVLGASTETINVMVSNNQASVILAWVLETGVNGTKVADSEALGVNHIAYGPLPSLNEELEPILKVEPAQLSGWRKNALTKNLRDPQAGSIVLDLIYSEEHEVLNSWGTEDVTFEYNEDGDKINTEYVASGEGYQNAPSTGIAMGRWLWNNSVFPQIRFVSRAGEIQASPEANGEWNKTVFDYPRTMPIGNSSFLSLPTLDEIAIIDKYQVDFETLSNELAAKIYRGDLNIHDDYDDIIAQLNAVGMQEMLKVYQDRSARFREAQ